MTVQLPDEVLPTAIGVLIYSSICLLGSISLLCVVIAHREPFSYVSMLSFFTSLSTIASIIQQIHTIVLWRDVKLAQYEHQVAEVGNPELAIAGSSIGVDLVLFYIQYYSYNVEALLTLCWAGALAQSVFQMKAFKNLKPRATLALKTSAVLLPVIQVTLLRTRQIQSVLPLFFVIANIIMIFSLTLGSLLLFAILLKYIQTRRALLSWHVQYGQTDMSQGTTSNNAVNLNSSMPNRRPRNIYDHWLVLRFSIAFIALGIFQVVIILFEMFSMRSNTEAYLTQEADLSISRARTDFVLFLPGVSASLLAFVVFGTTKTFREYMWMKLVPRYIRRKISAGRSTGTPSLIELHAERQHQVEGDDPMSPYVIASDGPRYQREMGAYTPTHDGSGIRLRDMEPGTGPKMDDEWPIFITAPLTK